MPALMAAAACSDDSEGECGDGWFSVVAVVILSDVCLRVGDGGSEFRSGGIVACFVQSIKVLLMIDRLLGANCQPVPRYVGSPDVKTKSLHQPTVHASCDYQVD